MEKAEENTGEGKNAEEDEEKMPNTDKDEGKTPNVEEEKKEDAGREKREISGGQAGRLREEQEENATRGEGDDAQYSGGSTAGRLDRRAGGRKDKADEEGAGGAPEEAAQRRDN
ncbi:hypothetical protein NDU88_005202 [Pleurodeles waltl]|uniref:Uncharacterized protein n=1 Tax=Pleurodeles waltl TaxID=8319 RepID=A0AAV7QHJ6_PLEWA|nr:hypothetical protein NDU88_005202 [Pleurodeles waltl]